MFKHDTVHLGSFFCTNPDNVYIFLSSTDRKLEQSDLDDFRKMEWYQFFASTMLWTGADQSNDDNYNFQIQIALVWI